MPLRRSMLVTAATVATVVLITGCGDASPGDASASAPPQTTPAASPTTESPVTSSASPTPTKEIQEITVTIADGEITPPPDRIEVDEGTTVRIVVTSDEPDEVHVHGYELEASVGPGETGAIEFVADQTGLFEVELHELEKVLFQLQVQ